MDKATRDELLNPPGQPFTLSHRLILELGGYPGVPLYRPSCACGTWEMHGYIREGAAHALFGQHCSQAS